jgi:putative exporter of polyketide antibiotics
MKTNWKDSLKRQWNENPLYVLLVSTTIAAIGIAAIDAASSARSKNAYAKQINQKYN